MIITKPRLGEEHEETFHIKFDNRKKSSKEAESELKNLGYKIITKW